jgi:hypothetical protein
MAKRPNQRQPHQPTWRKKMEDQKQTVAPAALPETAAPETAAAPTVELPSLPPSGLPSGAMPDIGAIVQAELQKALAGLGIPAAAAPATPTAAVAASTLRPDADPNFVEGPGQERTEFTISLLERHADWLRRVAKQNGVAPARLIEILVRREWAADPTKGGTILVALPDEKGQPAATAPRAK